VSRHAEVDVLKAILAERDRRYDDRFGAQERANTIALDAANERLARMNEFRAQLTDQAATFATRTEMNAEFRAVNATLARLETKDANNAGRGSGMSQLWGFIVGAAGVIIAVVAVAQNALR
jgi:Flp pilus assembly protein TadB